MESVVTEEPKPFEGGVNPAESVVKEELKPFESGVNSVESAVTEELPTLEVTTRNRTETEKYPLIQQKKIQDPTLLKKSS